jgi:hypothetical protein
MRPRPLPSSITSGRQNAAPTTAPAAISLFAALFVFCGLRINTALEDFTKTAEKDARVRAKDRRGAQQPRSNVRCALSSAHFVRFAVLFYTAAKAA